MEILERQVRRARRRLLFEQWLRAASWCCTATLLAILALVVVDKFWALRMTLPTGFAIAIGASLLMAAGWTYLRRWQAIDAALEIDRRYGLRERVSSAYALLPEQRETPMGEALIHDAQRRVEQIRVADRFPIALSGWSMLPLAPAALALIVGLFVGPFQIASSASAAVEDPELRKQVQTSSNTLRKKLSEQREQAEREGLTTAEDLFEKLERQTEELARADNVDQKQALVNLNDLAEQLDRRRDQLRGSRELAEQFKQLDDMQRGPADRLADALREGNLNRAREELNKLREQMAAGELDAEDQQKLADQAEQMAEKLSRMADEHNAAKEELAQRAEEARKAGREEEARQLEEQLGQLARKDAQMARAEQMSQQLPQAGEKLEQGDQQGAQQAFEQLDSDLAELDRDLREMEMIEQGQGEISQAKQSLNCKQCTGQGCAHCESEGMGQGSGDGIGKGGQRPPLERDNADSEGTYDTNVRGQVGRGSGEVIDYVDGPNRPGGVQQEIDAQFQRAHNRAADPLTEERLPRGYREHAQEYFDALREGRP